MICGIILISIAIILYSLFHNINNLSLFSRFPHNSFYNFYIKLQSNFIVYFHKVPFYKLLNNYLVDILWAVSFCLIFFNLIEIKLKYFVAFSLFLIIELLQLKNPVLGTFDFVDLLIYLITIFIFFMINESKA